MFEGLSLAANLGVFAGAAALVWFAGTRIAHHADAIAEKTGIGRRCCAWATTRSPRSASTSAGWMLYALR